MPVLCATDFSEASAEATRVAARLAQRLGERLLLVHVFTLPSAGLAGLDAAASLEYDRLMREGVADALSDAVTAAEDAGVEVETRILEGSPPAAIAECAKDSGARLVVVGSVGRGAVARLVVGSVTDRLARICDRPVLAVRGETAGFDAWARGDGPLRVVMGLDRSAPSTAALEVLRTLRRAGPVDVTFVHAYWPPAEAVDLAPGAGAGYVAPDEAVVARLRSALGTLIGELPGEGETRLEIWPTLGNLGYLLDRFATDVGADLVLVGSHRLGLVDRLWRGGASHGTLHHAHHSVLCVPVDAAGLARGAEVRRLHRLLVATDLSAPADAACRQAYGLVGAGGEVHLCTVMEGAPDPEARRRLEGELWARVPRASVPLGIRTEVHVLEGQGVGGEILAAAERLGAEAVVVGSRGRGGISRALLGSVTEAILRDADRPVLVVKAGAA